MVIVKEARSTRETAVCHRDLYSVLSPITWICRFVGIFPLKLEGSVGKRKYSTSWVLIIYSLPVLVLIMTGLYTWTDNTHQRNMKISENRVVQISITFEMVIEIISMAMMVAAAILSRDKFANAIDCLISQDISLRKLGTKLDYEAESKQHYMQLGIIIFVILILHIYDFIYRVDFNISHPLNWISWACPNIVHIASACLFVDVVLILKQRFGVLNDHLRKMIEETNGSPPAIISTSDELCDRICSIAMIHGALCEAALTVNQTFSCAIITGVIYGLIILTNLLYNLFQEIKTPDCNYLIILGIINWAIITSSYVIYIVVACHFTQDQASLTGKLIHKFRISGVDTPFNNAIQSFSLQLHHEKIEFSAAGFFPLNAVLIQSIISTVTTYLVILLQINP